MSHTNDVAVLDIGSKKLSAYVAERLGNSLFTMKTSYAVEYSGYMEGDWLDYSELYNCLSLLLSKIEVGAYSRIKKLYVGLPAQFCVNKCVNASLSFAKPKRITDTEIDSLFHAGNPFDDSDAYTSILETPIYYALDTGAKVVHPYGIATTLIKGHLSYVAADKNIISQLDKLLGRLGIKTIQYVPAEYAAMTYLFDEDELDKFVLMLDIGYLSSSITLMRGDGVEDMRSFSLGGSLIIAGISTAFDLPFNVAESLYHKINLTIDNNGSELYNVLTDDATIVLPVGKVNDVVRACLETLATYIKKALEQFTCDFPGYITVNLTGGGITEIRGAKEYLARLIGKSIEVVMPNIPNYNKPYYSSAVGITAYALEQERLSGKFSFFRKLISK